MTPEQSFELLGIHRLRGIERGDECRELAVDRVLLSDEAEEVPGEARGRLGATQFVVPREAVAALVEGGSRTHARELRIEDEGAECPVHAVGYRRGGRAVWPSQELIVEPAGVGTALEREFIHIGVRVGDHQRLLRYQAARATPLRAPGHGDRVRSAADRRRGPITWETVRGAEPLQFGFRSRPMLARPEFAASRKRRVPNIR